MGRSDRENGRVNTTAAATAGPPLPPPAHIADYAVIGDLHTVGLIHRNGSLDWLCLPDFDSPACFARLVGDQENGHWRIAPAGAGDADERRYHDDSMVLESTWSTSTGSVRVIDFMPMREGRTEVVRIVEGLSGSVDMRSTVRFRFDYGHIVPWLRHPDGYLVAVAGPDAVWLRTDVPLDSADYATVSDFTVTAGDRVPFVLTWAPSWVNEPSQADPADALTRTKDFWAEWIGRCRYEGPRADLVRRSLMVLKVLTYRPTGGILAAPTTSLPELVGGERNWDYRFCWLRDATFSLQALLACGYSHEAAEWRHWLLRAAAGDPGDLQPMYTLRGGRRMPEWTAGWLAGFAGSTPVRIGNGAAGQFQLDVWGEVLGSLSLARDYDIRDGHPTWRMQVELLDRLAEIWTEPDEGVWETRGEQQHFVYSKMQAWVAFDRMARAVREGKGEGDADRWQQIADEIHDQVCTRGFDEERNTFTQFYGSTELDASTLLMSKIGFLPGDDPRVLGTIDAVRRELADGVLVRRYSTDGSDGFSQGEGAFLACSFWLVEALADAGRVDQAGELFDGVVALANDLGLLSEEYDPTAGQLLGNFPQAYSHVGLINAAVRLHRAAG